MHIVIDIILHHSRSLAIIYHHFASFTVIAITYNHLPREFKTCEFWTCGSTAWLGTFCQDCHLRLKLSKMLYVYFGMYCLFYWFEASVSQNKLLWVLERLLPLASVTWPFARLRWLLGFFIFDTPAELSQQYISPYLCLIKLIKTLDFKIILRYGIALCI